MIGPVLVGLDGSAESLVALRWAGWFAAATQRPLHLVHAWQHGTPLEQPLAAAVSGSGVEVLEVNVEDQLRAMAAGELADPTVVAGCRALRGDVVSSLDKEAARVGAGLVVVGARGAGGALRSLLGSVSRGLTQCPARAVAVVPAAHAPPADGPLTLLVGVDGSVGSSRALRWAGGIAQAAGAEVVVAHGFEPPSPGLSREERAHVAHEVQQQLEEEWCAPLRTMGVPHRSVLDLGGGPQVIGMVARSVEPACVVVGSRGLGPFSQRLLGSVTHRLVRDLDWPTVIIPSPRDCAIWNP